MRRFSVLSVIALLFFFISSCHIARFIYYNNADLNDYRKFPQKNIQNSGQVFSFYDQVQNAGIALPVKYAGDACTLESFLTRHSTVAFLVIRNDSILYENYFDDYTRESIIPSFSVAKSYVSALVGIAIREGYIKSVHQPITDFLPELQNPGFEKITLEHLLNMRSGIRFNENYLNPFSQIPKYYYGLHLAHYISKLKVEEPPDLHYNYVSVNTLLLSMAVERATKKQLSQYLEEKIWQPCGMEYPATWNIDSKKGNTIKAFCCVNARTRDFARFGRLYLHAGNWNGREIIPEEWVKKTQSVMNDSRDGQNYHYTYQWRITNYGAIFSKGILGQYIWILPQKNIIIVRLGRNYAGIDWADFCYEISKKL